MGYKNLNYIVEIANQRNISKAAERLFISQSALSIYLKRIEKELGVDLFIRRNNLLIPTPEGELFVSTTKEILRLEEELYTRIHKSGNDVFTVGIASEMGMAIFTRVLSNFKKTYPNFRARVLDKRSGPLLDQLKEGSLKCIMIPSIQPVPESRFHCEILKQEELVFVLPGNHPLAYMGSNHYDCPPVVDGAVFRNERFILAPADTIERQLINRLFHDYQIQPQILFEINRTLQICQMLKEEEAITIQPEFCIPRDMDLVVCRPDRSYCRYMQLIYRTSTQFTQEERKLIKAVKNAYE